jgi:predicted Zn finger-like uncharacterized protein
LLLLPYCVQLRFNPFQTLRRDAMLIVCPNCSASYDISSDSLGATGRTVRCTECKTVWFAAPDEIDTFITESVEAKVPPVVNLGREEPMPEVESSLRTADDKALAVVVDDTDGPDDGGLEDIESAALHEVPGRITVGSKAREKSRFGWFRRKPREADAFAAPKIRVPRPKMELPGWVALTCIIGLGGLVLLALGRNSVTAFFPETAYLFNAVGMDVNVRGLAFKDVKTSEIMQNGAPMLIAEGVIENVTSHDVDIPRLRLAVRSAEGRELFVWTVIPGQPKLKTGASLPFRAQLASPPLDGRQVAVRLMMRQDMLLTN